MVSRQSAEADTASVAGAAERGSTIVLATDGTSQSEHAVGLARLVGARVKGQVRVVTVLDQLPVPWRTVDSTNAIAYERGLKAEALTRVQRQLNGFGDSEWPVEVETGDPAERISMNASECDAKLVVVGLGEHGGAARVFGSETAVRLAHISETPMLAVEPHLSHLPRRILVAMDFSEASIEAARVAIELADASGSMVLVHVVPWQRTPYVPEELIRSEEASISSELSRVTGWLKRRSRFRIGQRILWGQPGRTILQYAEELDADLIATGTHGRTAAKRLIGGKTVDKLIRGAHCSVLVFPAAAAFRRAVTSPVSQKMALQDAGQASA